MMYGNCGQMPQRNIRTLVTESKTGKNITPANRALFVANHEYSAGWTTAEVLKDFRAFVLADCSLDY